MAGRTVGILSKAGWMRATSSMRSASRRRSGAVREAPSTVATPPSSGETDFHGEPQPAENGRGFREGNGRAEERVEALRAEAYDRFFEGHSAHDERRCRGRASGELGEQRLGSFEDVCDGGPVGAALEAVTRVGGEAVPARGAPNAARREISGLEDDAARARADLAVFAAHHSGLCGGRLGVGDDEVVRVEGPRDAVERLERLTLLGAPYDDLRALDERVIEGVHGLAELEHQQVRHVDDIRDGAHAERVEAIAEPSGRRPDRHAVDDGGAVRGATLRFFDPDGKERLERQRGYFRGLAGGGRLERQGEQRSEIARDADVPERVGAIRGDAHFEHGVARGGDELGKRRTGCGRARGEHDDAFRRFGEPELLLAAEACRHFPRRRLLAVRW